MFRSFHNLSPGTEMPAEAHITYTCGSVMFCSAECKSPSNKNWKCKHETKHQGILESEKTHFGNLSARTVCGFYKTNTQITLQVTLGIHMAHLTFSF